jgi:hypothetical protein
MKIVLGITDHIADSKRQGGIEKQVVNLVGEELADDSDPEICVAKWVDTP